jgi:hypothetical protein
VPGSMNGITLHITHMSDNFYPLNSAHFATPSVDVHVNIIDLERYGDSSLHVERNTYFPIAAGTNTRVEYSVQKLVRKQGWGSEESRLCKKEALPRSSCVDKTLLDRASASCNCSKVQYFTDPSELCRALRTQKQHKTYVLITNCEDCEARGSRLTNARHSALARGDRSRQIFKQSYRSIKSNL